MRTLTFALMALIPTFANANYLADEQIPEDVEVVCMSKSDNDMDPQLIMYYNYGDSPIAMELNYFADKLIEPKSLQMGETKMQYGYTIVADSANRIKHYTYAIEVPVSMLSAMPDGVTVISDYGDKHVPIPVDFRQCILDNLKKHAK